jgi:cell division transport system permease protein
MSASPIGRTPGRRRRNPNYLNAILMITLVLVLVGVVGMLVLNAQLFSRTLKEGIRVSVYLRDDLNEVEQLQLRKKIETEPFVRETEFVGNEEARAIYARRFGEDARDILGDYNPFPASYELGLQAAWVRPDSMAAIERRLETYREVRNVKAHNDVVARLNASLRSAGLVLAGLSLLVAFIAITLIDKTIRLAMYANRFVIRSMQLVGATRGFIVAPYLRRGVLNGLIAGLVALAILAGLLVALQRTVSSVPVQDEILKFAGLFAGVLVLGLLISVWSTHRSVSKYLGMKLDELY